MTLCSTGIAAKKSGVTFLQFYYLCQHKHLHGQLYQG